MVTIMTGTKSSSSDVQIFEGQLRVGTGVGMNWTNLGGD